MVGRAPLAVISGGSSGIGLAIACLLAEKGYRLALIARDSERLGTARNHLLAAGAPAVLLHALDVSDAAACEIALVAIGEAEGPVDWLITSAGIVEPGMFLELSAASHREQMEINYFGTLNLVRPVAAAMAARGAGRIVMIASAAAFVGIAGYSAYAPGKFAIRGLGETLRAELAPHGISVSVAFPPDTDTPQHAAEQALLPEATRRISSGGGLLSAEAVARAIVAGAEKGRFMLAPSLLMTLYGYVHSLWRPFSLRSQARVVASVREGREGD